jgi:large subunit ribosomal protein L4
MPKKMRRGALRSALSERLREGNLIIVDEFGFKTPKTKDFLGAIGGLGLSTDKKQTKTLIVDSLDNANLVLSSRNVQKTKVTNSFGLNIYDILYHEKLLISKTAVEELNNLLDPKREGGKEEAAPAEVKAEEKPKAKRIAKPKTDEAAEAKPPAKKKVKAETPAVESEEVTNNE